MRKTAHSFLHYSEDKNINASELLGDKNAVKLSRQNMSKFFAKRNTSISGIGRLATLKNEEWQVQEEGFIFYELGDGEYIIQRVDLTAPYLEKKELANAVN